MRQACLDYFDVTRAYAGCCGVVKVENYQLLSEWPLVRIQPGAPPISITV
jgi:hypothetical protein